MNLSTENPATTPALDDSNSIKIAIVMEIPVWKEFAPEPFRESIRFLGLEGPMFLLIASKMLEKDLQRDSIPAEDLIWRGVGYDGIIRFRTTPSCRREALEAAVAFVKSYPILDSLATVAWFCSPEEAWYEHHRCGCQIDLHKFFTPERQQTRRDDAKRIDEIKERLISFLPDNPGADPK